MGTEKKPRKRFRKRTCPGCGNKFLPKPQHAHNQHWCSRPDCQVTRKRVSRWFWLKRNPGHYILDDLDRLDLANGTAKVTGKGSKDRVVPIGKTALGFLENYIKAVRPFLVKDPENKALFLDKFGKRLPYHTLRRLVHAFAEKRGVPVNVTPHTFRRSCATELLRAGAGMYHVKDLLGHESLETLRYYAKLTIRDLKKEHQRCHPRERDAREIGR